MMYFLRAPVAALCLALCLELPAEGAQVYIPAGTQVSVQLISSLTSRSAQIGERFAFKASAPVLARDKIVIVQGANGIGRVAQVTKAHGRSAGGLTLEFVKIDAVDGTQLALTDTSRSQSGSAQRGKASTATIAATVALGPLGLFAHNLVKGKDVTVTPRQTFSTSIRSSASVNVR